MLHKRLKIRTRQENARIEKHTKKIGKIKTNKKIGEEFCREKKQLNVPGGISNLKC